MSDVTKTTRKRKGAASARTPEASSAGQAGAAADAARARLAEGTGLDPQNAQFAGDAGSDPVALARQLTDELRTLSRATTEDPFSNPVLRLALDLSRRLEQGQLSYGALEQLVQYLSAEGFLDRAGRFGRYLGETDPEANEERLRQAFTALTRSADGGEAATVPFESFRVRVEDELFGVVTTAHPTFNISGELILIRTLNAFAFLLPVFVAAYFFLKTREVAR